MSFLRELIAVGCFGFAMFCCNCPSSSSTPSSSSSAPSSSSSSSTPSSSSSQPSSSSSQGSSSSSQVSSSSSSSSSSSAGVACGTCDIPQDTVTMTLNSHCINCTGEPTVITLTRIGAGTTYQSAVLMPCSGVFAHCAFQFQMTCNPVANSWSLGLAISGSGGTCPLVCNSSVPMDPGSTCNPINMTFSFVNGTGTCFNIQCVITVTP